MPSGQFLQIDIEAKRVQEALKGTRLSMKSIGRKTFKVIGRGVIKAMNRQIRHTLQKRTGALLKTYKYYATKTGGIVRVRKDVDNGSDTFRKLYALNYGYSGSVARARNKPHSFVEAGQAYIDSGAYVADLERAVEKELKKFWGGE